MKNILLTLGLFLTFGVASAQNNNTTGTTTSTTTKIEKDSVMHDHSGMHQTTKTKKTKQTARTHRSGNPDTNPGAVRSNSVKNTNATTTRSVNTGVNDNTPLEGSSPQTTSDVVAPEGSLNSRVAPVNSDRNSSTVIDNGNGTTTTINSDGTSTTTTTGTGTTTTGTSTTTTTTTGTKK